MNHTTDKIRVVICVPFVRTFLVVVKYNQKIKVIKEAFPNLKNDQNLVYWFKGYQLSPNSTFHEARIIEYSTIIATIQTENDLFNKYFMSISKASTMNKILNNMVDNLNCSKNEQNPNNHMLESRNYSYEKEKRKYTFIQQIKLLFHQYDFSKINRKAVFEKAPASSVNNNPMTVFF